MYIIERYIMAEYTINIYHNIASYDDFIRLGVCSAWPTFIFILQIMLDEECIYNINLTLTGHFYCQHSYGYDHEKIEEECVVDDDANKHRLNKYVYKCNADELKNENIFSSELFINSISKSIAGTLYDEYRSCYITRFIQKKYSVN